MKRQDLLNALETVRPGLSTKEIVAGSTSFAFMNESVISFNDEISVRKPVEGLELTGAIEASELFKILGKLKSEDIEIQAEENEVVLKSGRAKCGFRLQSEIKLPIDQIGKKGKWQQLPENFLKALEFSMQCCTHDMSRPVLTCINVRSDGKVEASDNYRVSRYQVEEVPVKTFLLPYTSAQVITKYAVTKIAEGENWIHFKTNDGTEFSCRTFEETFPKIDNLLNVEGVSIELPAALQDVLERAAVFCTQEQILDQKITANVTNRRMKLRAESDTSWFEEEVNMAYKGEDLNFTTNPHLLKTILSQTRKCILGERCLKFSTEDWQHIIALIV